MPPASRFSLGDRLWNVDRFGLSKLHKPGLAIFDTDTRLFESRKRNMGTGLQVLVNPHRPCFKPTGNGSFLVNIVASDGPCKAILAVVNPRNHIVEIVELE